MTSATATVPASAKAQATVTAPATVRVTAGSLVTVVALVGALLASVLIGSRGVDPSDVVRAFTGHSDTIGAAVVTQRLPRTLLAVFAGAALAVAGLLLQSVARNSLADPGILGITSGSALAVVVSLTVLGARSPAAMTLAAIVGAATAACLLLMLASLGAGGDAPLKIVLSGAAISALGVSVTSALILPRPDAMEVFRFWQIGGVGGARWSDLTWSVPVIAVVLLVAWVCAPAMNTLALGDDAAAGLGVSVGAARLSLIVTAIVLTGIATSLVGPIGFLGLIVPHACRLLIGTDHRALVPLTAVGGGVLLLLADVLGRVLLPPGELEAGIITALIGAPVLIWIVRRRMDGVR